MAGWIVSLYQRLVMAWVPLLSLLPLHFLQLQFSTKKIYKRYKNLCSVFIVKQSDKENKRTIISTFSNQTELKRIAKRNNTDILRLRKRQKWSTWWNNHLQVINSPFKSFHITSVGRHQSACMFIQLSEEYLMGRERKRPPRILAKLNIVKNIPNFTCRFVYVCFTLTCISFRVSLLSCR